MSAPIVAYEIEHRFVRFFIDSFEIVHGFVSRLL
jgi:hypothetical protein